VSGFGETINYDPNAIVPFRGTRQFGDEVHGDILPRPLGDFGLNKETGGFLVLGFNSGTSETSSYKERNVTLHARPPIKSLQVLIHLAGTGMNGVSRLVVFFQDSVSEIMAIGKPDTIVEHIDTVWPWLQTLC